MRILKRNCLDLRLKLDDHHLLLLPTLQKDAVEVQMQILVVFYRWQWALLQSQNIKFCYLSI